MSSPETDRPRLPSRAVPITTTVVLAGVWLGIFQVHGYWAAREAGGERSYYGPAVALARTQLELTAAGLRRCAARAGALPARLEACTDDTPRLEALFAWVEAHKDSAGHLRYQVETVDEPWHRGAYSAWKEGQAGPAPPPGHDFFGLPLIYRPGQRAPESEAWVDATTRPDPDLQRFLGRAPPASPRPFALSSVFLQQRVSRQAKLDRKAWNARALQLGGFLGVVLAGVVLTLRWRGKKSRWPGKLAMGLGGGLSVLFVLGSAVFTATCYAMAQFRSSSMSRADRLALLDEAVRKGEVPREVARTARRYIEKLPERQP